MQLFTCSKIKITQKQKLYDLLGLSIFLKFNDFGINHLQVIFMLDSCCFMNGPISLKPRDHSLSVIITLISFLIMNFGNSTDGLIKVSSI